MAHGRGLTKQQNQRARKGTRMKDIEVEPQLVHEYDLDPPDTDNGPPQTAPEPATPIIQPYALPSHIKASRFAAIRSLNEYVARDTLIYTVYRHKSITQKTRVVYHCLDLYIPRPAAMPPRAYGPDTNLFRITPWVIAFLRTQEERLTEAMKIYGGRSQHICKDVVQSLAYEMFGDPLALQHLRL